MNDNRNNHDEELLKNSSFLIEIQQFFNEYDIFDVDYVELDDIKQSLSTKESRQALIEYLKLVRLAETGNNDLTNEISKIIEKIKSLDDLERM